MKRITISVTMLMLMLTSLTLTFNIDLAMASGTIYIRADGSVEGTDKIQRDGDIYTFTDNINDEIVIEKSNIMIDGNSHILQGAGSGNGFFLEGRTNVTIRNIRIMQFYAGISLVASPNNTITENTVSSNTHGIHLLQSTGCTVNNNIVASNQGGIVVYQGSDYTTVEYNTVHSNTVLGIDLGMANWCTIVDNNITSSFFGIELDYSSNNVLIGNNVTSNNYLGIGISSSGSNTISSNNVSSNSYAGIRLDYSDSNKNTMADNIVSNNDYGIFLASSANNNNILMNNIANNNRGTYLSGTSNNTFFHNNFVGNIQQAVSYDSTNLWDDGYPSGGNYWSDYTLRYPDAHELDGSGIWDTPYVIEESNRDNYPLMKPWTPTPETVMVSVLIDYGNGTRMLHTNVTLPLGSTVLDATLNVAQVDYTSHSEFGVFVNAINDVWNAYPYWWIWWYWDPVECTWILGPAASNQYALSNCEMVAWYYENTEIWPLPQPPWTPIKPVASTINIDPDTLNLKSKGKWITAYIQPPEGYNPSDIDASTIFLNGTIMPVLDLKYSFVTNSSEYLVDYDNDGILERMVKFDRTTVESFIISQGIGYGNTTLTITGKLLDGTPFEGTDIILVNQAFRLYYRR